MQAQKKDILYSALISYEWLFMCNSENFPLKNSLEQFEKRKRGPIVNAGTLISFAYMVLVFGKESNLYNKFLIKNLDIDDFQIELGSLNKSDPNMDLVRRLRNSLAHSNIKLEDKYLIFEDGKPDEDITFRVRVLTADFGKFVNKVLENWNNFEKALYESNKNKN